MTVPEVTTRRYRSEDAAATLNIFRRAVNVTAALHYTLEQRRAWAPEDLPLARWEADRAGARTWVALHGGRVAGFTDLDLHGHIGMLYVDPDRARRGVASQLLALIMTTAEEESLLELTVDASRTARPFFQRHGFTSEATQQVERAGAWLTNYRMRRTFEPGPAADSGRLGPARPTRDPRRVGPTVGRRTQ